MFVTPGLKRKREDAAASSFDRQVAQYQSGDIKRGGVTLKAQDGRVCVYEAVRPATRRRYGSSRRRRRRHGRFRSSAGASDVCRFHAGEEPPLGGDSRRWLAQVADYLQMEALYQPLLAAMADSVDKVDIGQLVGLRERWPHHQKFAVVPAAARPLWRIYLDATWLTAPKAFVRTLSATTTSASAMSASCTRRCRGSARRLRPLGRGGGEAPRAHPHVAALPHGGGARSRLPMAALVAEPPAEDESSWLKLFLTPRSWTRRMNTAMSTRSALRWWSVSARSAIVCQRVRGARRRAGSRCTLWSAFRWWSRRDASRSSTTRRACASCATSRWRRSFRPGGSPRAARSCTPSVGPDRRVCAVSSGLIHQLARGGGRRDGDGAECDGCGGA